MVEDRECPVSFRRSNSSRILGYSSLRCTFEKYMWALHRLEDVIPVWPGTLECRAASRDRNAISLLDSIARDVTKSHRPTTQLITPESKPDARACRHVVVKREASASSRHIEYPWNEKMKIPDDPEECQLLMQPYVPAWDKVGQWRCLMVDRALFCIFINPGSSMLGQHHSHVSAHSLREDGWSLEELGL
jgi:hypothetical protein